MLMFRKSGAEESNSKHSEHLLHIQSTDSGDALIRQNGFLWALQATAFFGCAAGAHLILLKTLAADQRVCLSPKVESPMPSPTTEFVHKHQEKALRGLTTRGHGVPPSSLAESKSQRERSRNSSHKRATDARACAEDLPKCPWQLKQSAAKK